MVTVMLLMYIVLASAILYINITVNLRDRTGVEKVSAVEKLVRINICVVRRNVRDHHSLISI